MKKIIALVLVVVFAIFGGIFAVTHIKVIDAGKVGVVYSANGGAISSGMALCSSDA